MAIAVMPLFSADFGGGDTVHVSVEYDDVTMAVTVFIIDNPNGHLLIFTLTNPQGATRVRRVDRVLHNFRYDPVMPAVLVHRLDRKGNDVIGWPLGWSLTMQVVV